MNLYIVAYNPKCIPRLKSFVQQFLSSSQMNIYLVLSERLLPRTTWETLLSGLNVGETVYLYDDRFALDFSAYQMILELHCKEHRNKGAVIINDTFFTKHFSPSHYREIFEKAKLIEVSCPTANIMIGPHRSSEFDTVSMEIKEFVATYMFFATFSACSCLLRSFEELSEFKKQHSALVGAYSSQISQTSYPKEIIEAKMNAFCLERLFTRTIKTEGCIWFSGFGIRSKILIKVEGLYYRSLSRFSRR